VTLTSGAVARVGLGVVLIVMLLVAGCGGVVRGAADHGAAGGGTAPSGELTVDELREPQFFYQGDRLGQRVTVHGEVADVAGPGVLDLAGMGGTLTVMTRGPVTAASGATVTVTGTVGQLHTTQPSDRVPYIQNDLYAKATTETYLFDATIEQGGG
jgi:hypothetical protein